MNDADPANTVHYHLARLGSRLTGTSGRVEGLDGPRDYIDSCMTSEHPRQRQSYAFAVMTGWGALMAVAVVATLVFGYLADSAGGEAAWHVVVAIGIPGIVFCVAGMLNAMWRAVWFTWRAKRLGRHDWASDPRAMRGILPRNSSLIGQSLVAVLSLVVILV